MRDVRRFLHRLVTLFRPGAAESELSREIQAHLTLLEDQFAARGMSRGDARAAARRAFGGVEQAKERQREARTFAAVAGWSTDLKLGVRMLAKYPGLSLASGLTMAIAIGLGAAWFDLSTEMFRPTLPLPDGDRLVQLQVMDSLTGNAERRLLSDYATWRQELQTVTEVGAARTIDRNVRPGTGVHEQARVAEISASALRLAGVAPVIGRLLLEEDERPGAAAVAVIGHQLWQRWFGGRPEAIGQTVDVGGVTATVVGVMPDGFAFPLNHRLWVPLQEKPGGYGPLEGPDVSVMGRLQSGADREQAAAELAVLAARAAASSPATHEHLQSRVSAYGSLAPGPYLGLALTHIPIVLVLLVACLNVGTLVYARTASREFEIATRFTVGASRTRIVTQLFLEALALVLVAGTPGLVVADRALAWGVPAATGGVLPFWMEPGLRFTTVLFALALGVAAAALLSVLPALKATGAQTQSRLATTGERATLRFGRGWTAAMIAQVALTVFCLPPAIGITRETIRDRGVRTAFPAEDYLGVEVDADRDASLEGTPAGIERVGQLYGELERRLAQEPGVLGVTSAEALPGLDLSPRRIEIEGGLGSQPILIDGAVTVWTEAIGPGYFEALNRRIVAGRDFHNGDRADGARTVIVNESFARHFTDGTAPVGRRVRYLGPAASSTNPWLEIVGVAQDIGMTPIGGGEAPYMLSAVAPGSLSPAMLTIHISGDPGAVAARVRTIATELDPRLRIAEVRSLDEWARQADLPNIVTAAAILVAVALGLFLSASSTFALVSVTVGRRMRELGVRVALGASTGQLLRSIFLRVLILLGSGAVAGTTLFLLLISADTVPDLGDVVYTLTLTSTVMFTAGLLACVEPALRVLRINPTDALRTV